MDNLYKKLYEAIDTGIYRALVLPDEMTDDISVKFRHKKLSNDFDIIINYVRNLLDGNDTEYYYEQILEYHKKTHKKYKAGNFNELNDIFGSIKNIKRPNISWIDMSDTVTIILENNQEIPFDQFNSNIHSVKFIKFKNNITGHDIILHKDLLIKKDCKWAKKDVKELELDFNDIECINKEKYGSEDKAMQIAKQDYDGYKHTYHNTNIKSNNKDIDDYPAFKYCMKDLKDIDQKYEAYLPSMGELRFLCDNQYLINYILKKAKGEKINFKKYLLWSSTELRFCIAWGLYNGTFNSYKTYEYTVLPFFALKIKYKGYE